MTWFDCNTGGGSGISTPLWDTSDLIAGQYVSNTDGSFINDNTGTRTPLVEISEQNITVFVVSDWLNKYNAWYDANQNFISSFEMTRATSLVVLTVPANAKYVCFSNSNGAMPSVRAWDGDIT